MSSLFALAQSGGDQTPPGGDMLGSSPRPAQGQLGEQSRDAAQNQRMTGTMGTEKGYSGDPTYAGSSDYISRQNLSDTGVQGQQEFTSTAAGRRRAEDTRFSPYDSSSSSAQPYLSGQFGQSGKQSGVKQQPKQAQRKQQAPPKR